MVYVFVFGALGLGCYVRVFLVAASWASLVWFTGFSLRWLLLLQSTGPRVSVTAAHGLSCPEAGGIFLDQGSKPYPCRWKNRKF